jgi:hypothetical protein
MPGMPDKIAQKHNGHANGVSKKEEAAQQVDIKALEKRILSSTEHLNEILALISLLSVASLAPTDTDW